MPPRVAALVLAAGGSRRLGRPKLLLPYRGVPLLRRAVDAATAGGCDDVVVVLGADRERYTPLLAGSGARTAINPFYKEGMSSSLRTGLEAVPPDCAAALILLADQPRIGAEVVRAILQTYAATGRPIVAARYGEVRGVPVLFDRALFAELLLLEGDQGARAVLERHPTDVAEVVIPPDAAMDVDRPEDVTRLQRED